MNTSAEDCLVLFDTTVNGKLEAGWSGGVLRQRTKTTKAGPMVYVECYPVWERRQAQAAKSEAKQERHRKAQEKLNERNAQKKLVRLTNANFGEGDLILTLEYASGKQPENEQRAMKDVRNYLKRIWRIREKQELPPMKYIYVIEVTKSAQYGQRYHHHIIMSGGIGRDEAEAAWIRKHGGYCSARRAQPNEKHLTGFACYLVRGKADRTPEKDGKNPQKRAMRRRWNCSKNLLDPDDHATTADKKISIRKAGRIAETMDDFQQAKEIMEKLYPNCTLLEVKARRSMWTTGVYIAAELRKNDEGGGEHGKSGSSRSAAKPNGGRRADPALRVGMVHAREIPRIGADAPHPKRRKTRKGGSGEV